MTKLKSAANRRYFSKHWQLYSMLLIMFITLLIFNYWPMTGLQLAFKDWRIPIGNQAGGIWGSPWATDELGNLDLLKHFKTLFTNPKVYPTFFNTLRISLLRLVCGFPMPILLALFLNELTSDKFRTTLGLWSFVGKWNDWMTGLLYMQGKPNLQLIQTFLRRILNAATTQSGVADTEILNLSTSIRMAIVVVGMLPIVLMYPFVQKHFVKGVMLGSVKG